MPMLSKPSVDLTHAPHAHLRDLSRHDKLYHEALPHTQQLRALWMRPLQSCGAARDRLAAKLTARRHTFFPFPTSASLVPLASASLPVTATASFLRCVCPPGVPGQENYFHLEPPRAWKNMLCAQSSWLGRPSNILGVPVLERELTALLRANSRLMDARPTID